MRKTKVIVTQDKEKPISVEIIASSIKQIAQHMRAIEKSSLNRRAILVLLKDCTGINMNEIEKVLDSLSALDKRYCR